MTGKTSRVARRRVAGLFGLLILATGLPLAGATSALAAPPGYLVEAVIPVSHPSYIVADSLTNTIYADSGDSVAVINGATNKVTTSITAPMPTQMDINPNTDTLYVISGGDTLAVINGATDAVTRYLAPLPGLAGPITGIAVDPATDTVYVSSSSSFKGWGSVNGSISVINGATDTVTAVIAVPPPPSLWIGGTADAIAVDPATDVISVADNFDHGIYAIDGATNQIGLAGFDITLGGDVLAHFSGLTVDPGSDTLFGDLGQGPSSGDILVQAPVPGPPVFLGPVMTPGPDSIAVDDISHTLFVSNEQGAAGSVLLFDATANYDNSYFATVPVPGAAQLTIDQVTGTVYVSSTAGVTVLVPRPFGIIYHG